MGLPSSPNQYAPSCHESHNIYYCVINPGWRVHQMGGDSDAECDSMILIGLCYGKQTVVCEERGH